MSKIEFVKVQKVEQQRYADDMPDPKSLLSAAKKEEAKPIYLGAADYGEIADLLRRKGFTWPEIVVWFAEKGANFSQQGINSGWRKWRKDQGLLADDN